MPPKAKKLVAPDPAPLSEDAIQAELELVQEREHVRTYARGVFLGAFCASLFARFSLAFAFVVYWDVMLRL